MDKEEIEDYINKLKLIEKELGGEDDLNEFQYVQELDSLLTKLNDEIIKSNLSQSHNPTNDSTAFFNLKIKIKKLHPNAIIPAYSKDGDAGMDLTATQILNETTETITYGTGLAFEIPKGYVGLVFPRSSIRNYELQLSNSVGVIDSGYRGEVQATFNKIHLKYECYEIGDRIAQIMIIPYPKIEFIETNELSDTDRGVGGFGSTGT